MKPITAADPQSRSADLMADNVARLRELFPEAFTEGKIDFDVLKQLLGGVVEEREEKYGLNWHGKRLARRLALTPSTGTLRPVPGAGMNEDKTRNLMIEGENLEVLKLLQKSYSGEVKLIYIDPPYNTGNDFVYPDDFRDSIGNYKRLTGQTDGDGRDLTSNPETSGRFHTDWLNMMYPRLLLARQLLREDGVICVSIDDNEVHHTQSLLSELFGEENFIATIAWQKKDTPSNDAKGFSTTHEYIILYQKSGAFTRNLLPRTEEQLGNYKNPDNDLRGDWIRTTLIRKEVREDRCFPVPNPMGRMISPPPGTSWRFDNLDTFQEYTRQNRIWWGSGGDGDLPFLKRFLTDVAEGVVPITWWEYEFAGSNRNAKIELRNLFDREAPFETPKPTLLIRRLLQIATSSTEPTLVVDFFAGSGTTGHAVMELNHEDGGNRRFILVQMPEPTARETHSTISEITKDRLRRVIHRILKSTEGTLEGVMSSNSADLGFRVFRLDASNIRPWNPNASDIGKSLFDAVDHLETDRSEADILTELLLKLGLDLCVPIEPKTIAGSTVHSIGGGVLLVCLATKIAAKQVEPLAQGIVAWHKEQNPAGESQVVFRDSAFDNDVAKTNLTAILAQHGLTNVRSL